MLAVHGRYGISRNAPTIDAGLDMTGSQPRNRNFMRANVAKIMRRTVGSVD